MTEPDYLEEPPQSATLTSYDREHMKLYLRLLDAATENTDWREAMCVIFGLDPDADPERARRIYDAHLARAQWMTTEGYRLLAQESPRP